MSFAGILSLSCLSVLLESHQATRIEGREHCRQASQALEKTKRDLERDNRDSVALDRLSKRKEDNEADDLRKRADCQTLRDEQVRAISYALRFASRISCRFLSLSLAS